MRSIFFLFAMNFVSALGQSADSLVIREKHEFIQYVKEDRARAPLLSVIKISNQNDTSFGILPGVYVSLLISDLVDSVSVDSIVNRLLMWQDCIHIEDSTKAKYDVFEYRDSLSLTDQFREMTAQQLLDSYFDEGYFYYPFISKNNESALIVSFYERNIPMRFDDYWGNLRIDRVRPVLRL